VPRSSPPPSHGTTTAAVRNVVSGNNYGIVLAGASATGNTISGNYVGLNAAGTAALANSIGVDVEAAATGNTIGGTSAADRNVTSGNARMGVLLQNAGTSSASVVASLRPSSGSLGIRLPSVPVRVADQMFAAPSAVASRPAHVAYDSTSHRVSPTGVRRWRTPELRLSLLALPTLAPPVATAAVEATGAARRSHWPRTC
jgi:hypothetical protein